MKEKKLEEYRKEWLGDQMCERNELRLVSFAGF
jgi:hypothetical protein